MKIVSFFVAAAALAIAAFGTPAQAQEYPTKTVTLVVGYPPGGGADAIARLLSEKLADELGKAVIVDNRPGFSGNIGAQYVAKSAPDGYTLIVAPWTTYAINSILYGSRVGYSLEKDFTGISTLGFQPMGLLVNPSLPVHSAAELIAYAKSKPPGSLTFGSTGPGSLEQIAGEMFNRAAGISMLHVPYKGSGPAMTDLMSGQIQVYFATAPTVVQYTKGGRVRPLMITTPERNVALPDLPTPKESGLSNFEVLSTYGLFAPTGTPPAVVRKLNAAVTKVLQNPDIKTRFRNLGVDAVASTPEELTQRVPRDIERWAGIIKAADIKVEN